jgi:colanic acid biosynthesis glycosyl transferase WcaI
MAKAKIAVLYHYMHPDDVVSAHHFDGLAQGLAARGWDVEALPSNRGCRDETKVYGAAEYFNGVQYSRVWRPAFRQANTRGRLLNSLFMMAAWTRLAFRRKADRPHCIIVGTDPIFGVLTALPLKFFRPSMKIAHWCFDLHPEAAEATALVDSNGRMVRGLKWLLRRAYRKCDLIVDLGACMRKRLQLYDHGRTELELTPWALVEPSEPPEPDVNTRRNLFGDAKIGILYSGNFGEAHTADLFLQLARRLRGNTGIHFCLAIRGNHADKIKAAVTDQDTNISFPGFAPVEELEKRLAAADIHLASLKPEWTGIAVPSKFFGSIAMGRPVIYDGPRDSAIGEWINQCKCGWLLQQSNVDEVAQMLERMAKDKAELKTIQNNAFRAYQSHFSLKSVLDQWDEALTKMLAANS